MSWFCWSGTVGNAPVSLLQTCSPASMVASVFTQLSVTADASMPPGLVASWVRLISPAPGEAVGPRPKSSAVPTSLQHSAHTDLASIFLVSVYNAGPERDSICRSWGQYHVETFDGLYYYLSGKGSYLLVGHHEPESQSFSIQVRPLLSVCLSMQAPPGPGSWGSWDLSSPLSPAPGTVLSLCSPTHPWLPLAVCSSVRHPWCILYLFLSMKFHSGMSSG